MTTTKTIEERAARFAPMIAAAFPSLTEADRACLALHWPIERPIDQPVPDDVLRLVDLRLMFSEDIGHGWRRIGLTAAGRPIATRARLSAPAFEVLRLYAEAVRDGDDDPWFAGSRLEKLGQADRNALFASHCLELEGAIGGCKIAAISGTGMAVAGIEDPR